MTGSINNNNNNGLWTALYLTLLLMLFVALSLVSCSSSRCIEIERVQTDTIVLHDTVSILSLSQKVDSFKEVHNYYFTQKGDTVRQSEVHNYYHNSSTIDSTGYYKALYFSQKRAQTQQSAPAHISSSKDEYKRILLLFGGIFGTMLTLAGLYALIKR